MKWSIEEHNYLIQLKKKNLTWQQIAEHMTAKFEKKFTRESCRSRWRHTRHALKDEIEPNYKETVEIKADGSQHSDKLIEMTYEQSKDPNYLLKAHGYDIEEWELVSARSNIWHTYSTQDGRGVSYASKITVKPKTTGINFEKLLETIEKVKPIQIKKESPKVANNKLLEIPIYDPHFGISEYEYYKPTQTKIIEKIKNGWEEILFILGQDNFHNDNMRGTTAKGTVIENVDMVKAWEDARKFFEPMIELALKHSNNVKIIFSKGNHDESMSWAFVQYLKARFPQAEYDDNFQERKVHTFGKIFIGVTHGDKGRRELHNIFPAEFPLEWANAKIREIHIGHLHKEDAKDVYGTVIRTLATRNKTDQWHKDNGYIGAHKRFMLFEYSLEELESIHYV